MASLIVSLSVILNLTIFLVLVKSWNYDPSYDDGSFLPFKRNAMAWLSDHKSKNKHYRPSPDDLFNINPEGNCREITIDLNLDNNFLPSVIQHVYCHNLNDPHLKTCLYKDLVCTQKTETMFIGEKSKVNCMRGPEEHRRPVGCECKQYFGEKK